MATYNGDAGKNTYTGTGDPDYLYGFGGNDVLNGAGGDDLIDGGEGADTLDGGSGNDTVYGGAGKDAVSGGDGDDALVLFAAIDLVAGESYSGGAGIDTLRFDSQNQELCDLSTVTLDGMERLEANYHATKLTAAQLDPLNYIVSYAEMTVTTAGTIDLTGASLLSTGVFALTLAAGTNRLILTDVGQNVRVNGASGVDTMFGGEGVNYLYGGGGNDVLTGGNRDIGDVLRGEDDNDTLSGLAGNDALYGGAGDDTLDGGADGDTLTGGLGKDAVSGGDGDDVMVLDGAVDLVAGESYSGGAGIDTLRFDSQNQELCDLSTVMLDGMERLEANYHATKLTAAQLDPLNYIVSYAEMTVTTAGTIDLTGASLLSTGVFALTLAAGTNRLILTDVGQNVRVNGASGVDTMFGGEGVNYLYGGGGNDVLTGGNRDIGDVLRGEDDNDTLSGLAGNDNLYGGAGDDTLDGGADGDTLTGGLGKDAVAGGDGDDVMVLDGAIDLVAGESYSGGAGIDTLRFDSQNQELCDLSTVTLDGMERLEANYHATKLTAAQLDPLNYIVSYAEMTVTTAGTIDLTGASLLSTGVFALTLAAGTNRLILTDVGQNVRVNGASGVDTMFGGEGVNYLYGGGGNDVLTGGNRDIGDVLRGEDDNDTLSGLAGNDALYGGAGDDTLDGGADGDTLTGGLGKDAVSGGDGDDVMVLDGAVDLVAGESYSGGAGIDTLRFDSQNQELCDLSTVMLDGMERLEANYHATKLTAAQLDPLNYIVSYAEMTVTTAGTIDLTGASLLSTGVFALTLAAGTNRLILTDVGQNVRVNGASGVDTMFGGKAVNYLYGGGGNDVLTGGNGDLGDVLRGEDDNDTLSGLAGNDALYGGAGDDTLDGGADGDTLTGDDGSDTASYASAGAGVTVSLALQNQQQNTGNAGFDTLIGIENLTGSRFADTLKGDAGDNVIEGAGGNDTLDGGAGKDQASYAGAASAVTVSLAVKGAQATGGAGSDKLANFEGLIGSAFADKLTGDAGANTLSGGAGNDVLRGDGGADRLTGGDGTDIAVFSGKFADYDIVAVAGGYSVADRRGKTGDGSDTLTAIETIRFANGDFAIGDAVNTGPTAVDDIASTLREAGGRGPGVDTAGGSVLANDIDPNLQVSGLGERLVVNGVQFGGTGGAFGAVTAGGTVIQGTYGTLTLKADGSYSYQLDNSRAATEALATGQVVQEVFGYRIADAHGAASTATLTLNIEGDNETTLIARDDRLLVTLGTPSALSVGVLTANDEGIPGETLTVTAVSNAVGCTVAIQNGVLVVTAGAATGSFDYTLTNEIGATRTGHVAVGAVEIKISGNTVAAAADVTAADLVGNRNADRFTGSAGDDRLVGGAGDDGLDGRVGADLMIGGVGNDAYGVDQAGDRVVEAAGEGIDSVSTTLGAYTLGANVENLAYTGAGDFAGTGNALANVLTGGNGNDTLSGGDGDDTLIGGRGADLLDGGAGAGDTASYADAVRGVTVDLRITDAQATGAGADLIVNVENLTGSAFDDVLFGSDGANLLKGGDGRDVLFGNAGADRIEGGMGADILSGGAGADRFVLSAVSDSAPAQSDRILDFSHAQGDLIDLSAIDPDAGTAGDQAFTYLGAAAFTGTGGAAFEVRVVALDSDSFTVEADVNHDGVADLAISVTAAALLQQGDFML